MSAAEPSYRPRNRSGSVTFPLAQPLQSKRESRRGGISMKARFEEALRRIVLLGAIVTAGIAMVAPTTSAATFSARETHRGLVIDRADGTAGRLVANGWFRRP